MAIDFGQSGMSGGLKSPLASSGTSMGTSLTRIASGKRINSAADDAAGLAIATELSAEIRSQHQAMRNAGDGLSLVRTASSGLDSTVASLQRMRDLAMQAANGTLDDGSRAHIQTEAAELRDGMDAAAGSTEFNGAPLLDGSFSGRDLQVGTAAGDTLSVSIAEASSASLGAGAGQMVADIDLSTQEGAQQALDTIDAALDQANGMRASLGATENRISSAIANLEYAEQASVASRSQIQDANVASESASLVAGQIRQQAAISVMAQGNQMSGAVLGLLQ